jgi:hypothetical protein
MEQRRDRELQARQNNDVFGGTGHPAPLGLPESLRDSDEAERPRQERDSATWR